jgi:hypothetical protein
MFDNLSAQVTDQTVAFLLIFLGLALIYWILQ